MNDVTKGIEILSDIIKNEKRHADYKRVTELAETYMKLFTGENIDTLLRQFAKRETDEMFEQRKALYQSVMPAVANNLSKPYMKVFRSDRVFASIEHTSEAVVEGIRKAMGNFWTSESDTGVDSYLRTRWFDLVRFDPNAFFVVDFKPFDNNKEKAAPYPVEISSKEAIFPSYTNGKLDFLVTMHNIQYATSIDQNGNITYTDGHRYTMYLENDTIVFTQVDENLKETTVKDPVFQKIDGAKPGTYLVEKFSPKAGRVPAARVGVEPDSVTKGRTCVSLFHSTIPFFKKELKAGSELDITMALHVHQQKIQFAPRCIGDKEQNIPPCRDGKSPLTGGPCPVCHGSGLSVISTSGQDIILVPAPTGDETPVDLEKYVVYKSPSIELAKFQDEYVDKLTEKARKAQFSGTSVVQKEGKTTATEADYAYDDMYDTFHPFADKYSASWLFFVDLIAVFTDVKREELKLFHRFANDFKFKPLTKLFEERKSAKDAGVPQYMLDAIDIDIEEIIYADDPNTLEKIRVKRKFIPFAGKAQNEVQILFTRGQTTQYLETLYNHFEIIFNEIDQVMGDKFYKLPFEKQKALVDEKVEALVKELAKATQPFKAIETFTE